MSLSDRLPGNRQPETTRRSVSIVTIHCLLFAISLFVLLLMQRLGMRLDMMVLVIITMTLLLMTTLSWLGRTMTSPLFFFAGKNVEPAMSGIGGLSDWASGGLVVFLISATWFDQLLLAPAVILGVVLQFSLFATAMHKSKASSIAGFLNWRYQSQSIAMAIFLIAFVITALIIVAEFIVARDMLVFLTGRSASIAGLVVAIIAIIPTIFGGWLALHILNTAVVLWVLMCLLFPAILVGVVPGLLELITSPIIELKTLPKIDLSSWRINLTDGRGIFEALLVVVTIGCGCAALPQGLSRLSLVSKIRGSVQSLSWSSLFLFLVFSAVPLSLSLIVKDHSTPSAILAEGLTRQTVIHILPYLALTMLALNCLCLVVWMLCSSTVRIFRRSRNLNPDERSMFWVRGLALGIALLMFLYGSQFPQQPTRLFFDAVLISAGALFWPMFAACWLTDVARAPIFASILFGSLSVIACRFHSVLFENWQIELAFGYIGLIGLIFGAIPIVTSWINIRYRNKTTHDPSLDALATVRR